METNEKELTGYPSIDKPWLKYYSEEAINAPLPDCSMYEYLYYCNKDYLGNTALNYFGRKITYKKLFENIDKVAAALQKNGVKKGDIVSVCTLTAPETIYLLYAINKVGAVSNWLGLTSPVQDLHNQLDSTDSKLVFVVEMAYDTIVEAAKATKIEKIVSVPIEFSMSTAIKAAASLKNKHPVLNDISVRWKDFIESGTNTVFEPVGIDCNEMAVIIYTGGTTGIPKGVMLSNKSGNAYRINFLTSNLSGLTSYNQFEKFTSCVPLFLAFGLYACCHGPLCQTMELVLLPDPSPEYVAKQTINYKSNHIVAGRLHYDALAKIVNNNHIDLSYLKSAYYGGEQVEKIWEDKINVTFNESNAKCSILNGYGMTETSASILFTPANSPKGLIPFGNVNVRIISPDDPDIEYGYDIEGELCLSSDTIMLGYYKNEKETAETIFEKDGVRWLRTHDLATISKDGFITITGRIKRIYSRTNSEMIQVRVYPMRIEEELSKSKYVERCAVVGKKDDIVAYRSIAFIILKDKSANTETVKSSLEKLSRDNLPESHIPDKYIFVDEFPLTRAGKVDYRTLEKIAEEMQ
ncbi:MAG: acyl--CoA ligase [Ruminiclostridium sp.]|nr:acyl--CoA ligase [Ruminiclostridium sp.]